MMKRMTYGEYAAAPIGYDYWGLLDDERLSCQSIDAAIEQVIDDLDALPCGESACVLVHGFVRRDPSGLLDGSLLEHALEALDEEFGDPDAPHSPTGAMRAAEESFIRVILGEYDVWSCEPVVQVSVPILRWVRQHRPHWIHGE
jgi:hypothetical protein